MCCLCEQLAKSERLSSDWCKPIFFRRTNWFIHFFSIIILVTDIDNFGATNQINSDDSGTLLQRGEKYGLCASSKQLQELQVYDEGFERNVRCDWESGRERFYALCRGRVHTRHSGFIFSQLAQRFLLDNRKIINSK